MGYTIATPCKDQASKKKMLAFLRSEFRHWPKLIASKSNDKYYRGPIGRDLSYDHGPCRIGFDHNSSGGERDYVFTICRWMALKVGRIDEFPTQVRPELTGKFPVIVYDGDEATSPEDGEGAWPVILDSVKGIPEEYMWAVVDKFGIKQKINEEEAKFYAKIDGYDGWEIIRKEMKRLNEAWEKFNE